MLDTITLCFLCKRRTVPQECKKRCRHSSEKKARPALPSGGWTFERDPDPDRCADKPTIVPAFWGIVCRGWSKGGGGAVFRDRFRRVARRCSRLPVSFTIGYSRHVCTPTSARRRTRRCSLSQAAKKAGELVTNPSLPSFLRQFQFTFRCPTRFLHPTRTHPFS
jgi:hypothetical protein